MAKRPNILKLATKISLESMTYTGITYNDPEYKILEPIIDDEMCAIMMHLRLEANRTVEDVAKRAKQSVEYTQTQLDKLAKTGAVRYRYVDGKRCYFYPIWVPGIMEGILANREQCDKYPVLGESFEAYTRRRPEMLAPMLDSGKTGMFFMRVMPVMSAIENDTRTASYDELKTLIENATAISVGPCSCRRARRLMGEGCGHLEEDMCMYLNDNAVCYSEQGYHRLVTKEEAYEILRRAEDNGLVHEINQTPGFEDATAICNCCGCSCFALRIEELFRTPRAIRSNYIARVDKEKCVACGQCVENCQTNALKLGQKRCTTDPHISDTYDTDASVPYDRRSYDPEFRTNRSDVMPSGTAPCKAVCPLNIPVQGCLQLLSAGRYDDAAALIRQATPFPELCGSVCGRQCEKVCTRNQIDTAVAIADVCRTLVRRELDAGKVILPPLKNPSGIPHTEKIAVIGAGPAGLSCAYYLAERGYKPTVFEKNERPGGMLVYGIPSYKLEKDVVDAEIEVLRQMGVDIRCGVEVGRDITLDTLRREGYKAFYVAIGCQDSRSAGIPGEDTAGVMTAVDFLHAVAENETYPVEGRAVVIGGGNVAIDVARTSVRCGAAEVSMYCLEPRESMPASAEEAAEAEDEGVAIRCGWGPKEILAEAGRVTGIVLKRCVSVFDENGRFCPRYDEADTITVPCEHVFLSIGQSIRWGSLLDGAKVELGRGGAAVADPLTYQTAQPDIFVGGDVYTGPKFAIDAIAAGKQGAESLHRFVHENASLTIGRNRRQFKELDKESLALESYDNGARQSAGMDERIDYRRSFRDAHKTFTEEQVKAETARCLGCGASVVDPNKCIGCGLCTTKCEFDAIHLNRELPECSRMVRSEDKFKAILPYMIKREMKIRFGKKDG